ncbi:ATP-binding cassette domain-containing protein [Tahibacter harae]|uniref:ATP-binding cassette domain-containing protein n=1 Tax=Tahibacter harae TaxID=2963937 RepID=A0ABT1QN86_9GAMM|nr:ATP-binding cassette domain-containing protein [Tahibacter harae]MCQ4163988.1 ATP-binding cassette domain-containing protein [Tahibacter harae]
MTNPSLALQRAAFVLPDGRTLFSAIDLELDQRRTALIGRNGVGKSVLAQLLCGRLEPTAGRCRRNGRVHYLAQQIVPPAEATVAQVAGVAPVLAALARIEAGSTAAADFDRVGEHWDMRQRLEAVLREHDLGHLAAEQPAHSLSGGELTRVALAGAWLSEADFLVLDEPSNHLDRAQRELLQRRLREWPRGLLLVSHDRELLRTMQRIVELSAAGLHDYGGGYDFHVARRAGERGQAAQELARARLERRRGEAELREQRERQQRRQSRGQREGRQANQAPILLGLQKQRSEQSAGRLDQQQTARREALAAQVSAAAQRVEPEQDIVVFAPAAAAAAAPRRAAVLDQVILPYGLAAGRPLDLVIAGGQRIGLTGANGSGKSTLLKVLCAALAPPGGQCALHVPVAYLGQRLELLDAQQALLPQLLALQARANEAELRSRLALLGLDSAAVACPAGQLSGGERLKAALACALYRDQPAGLLLLDEPSNHLDLSSLQALEQMLRQYHGALVVVSHDAAFLAQLGLDTRLEIGAAGWCVRPWSDESAAGEGTAL